MSPVQTTYEAEQGPAFEGQRSDFGLVDINSKVNEDAAAIAFGRAVVAGSADDQAKLIDAYVARIEGITNETTAWTVNDSLDGNAYEQYKDMNLLAYGRIWVYAEATVVKGEPVFIRFASGSETVIGRFRNDEDAGTCVKLKEAIWETSGAAGTLQRISVRSLETELLESESVVATTGALSLNTKVSDVDTTAGAAALTLADGYEGQEKTIVLSVDGGDLVVTVANLLGGNTLTFANAAQALILAFTGGQWVITSNTGTVVVSTV